MIEYLVVIALRAMRCVPCVAYDALRAMRSMHVVMMYIIPASIHHNTLYQCMVQITEPPLLC